MFGDNEVGIPLTLSFTTKIFFKLGGREDRRIDTKLSVHFEEHVLSDIVQVVMTLQPTRSKNIKLFHNAGEDEMSMSVMLKFSR